MRLAALLILIPLALAAQPAKMKVLLWEYPSNELASVFFHIQATGDFKNWATIAVVDLSSGTNAYTFYRGGVDWRNNAPAWMTNFQFIELPPEPTKAKSLTAGSKTGKLSVTARARSFKAVPPPMPKL